MEVFFLQSDFGYYNTYWVKPGHLQDHPTIGASPDTRREVVRLLVNRKGSLTRFRADRTPYFSTWGPRPPQHCSPRRNQRRPLFPALHFDSSVPYQVFSVQREKAFWFHRRDRSCSDKNKPFSLPTDQTFLFLTEETLSGSPKETRPVLIRTNLLLFPQTKPFFSSQKKRFLVPPKRHVLF